MELTSKMAKCRRYKYVCVCSTPYMMHDFVTYNKCFAGRDVPQFIYISAIRHV